MDEVMMVELHSLLKRQLRRFIGDTESLPPRQAELMQAINAAYLQFDEDRRMLEHSLELTSQELLERNAELSRVNTELELRVAERTATLQAERDLLQALMDNIPDTIYFKDTASRFTRINRAQTRVLGVSVPEEAIGKTDLDFQDSELAQIFYKEEQRIIETGEPLINRVEFNPTKDGQPRWFSATKVPIKDSKNRVNGIVGVSRDITLLRQTEDALREAEIKYRSLVERLPVVIYTSELGATGAWHYVSPQIESLLGFTPEEWMADPNLWYEHAHPADRDRQEVLEEESHKLGEPFESEYRMFTRDHHEIWIRDSAQILPPHEGKLPIVQGVMVDITERKRTEEALQKSRELHSLWGLPSTLSMVVRKNLCCVLPTQRSIAPNRLAVTGW